MSFTPQNTLWNRTYIGLIIAQFLAAFNDQAIHAAAMFFAIRTQALSESQAIALMPILFYAPWAIFATVAGYLADKYSKRTALVSWKFAEIGITAVALLGFWLGAVFHAPAGPWIVLSTVFLMGLHSAFFVPAKYGVMPEILQSHLLSKGNGVLESTSFIGVILGTVSGGLLSYTFHDDREYIIGLILVGLAVIGAVASLLIRKVPAADPNRPFPAPLFKPMGSLPAPIACVLNVLLMPYRLFEPLIANIRVLIRSQPLYLAVIGIAFFTFIVAFMRATVYMHGQSQVPRWSEWDTSIIVGMVALGIGFGSPLAGWLSGGKVELGIIPFGAGGVIAGTLIAAFTLHMYSAMVGCIIAIGFFSGFYIVPLFTLLQHRAPKASKGDLVATSNFLNVTGAITASLLFYAIVWSAQRFGVVPRLEQVDRVYEGRLTDVEYSDKDHRITFARIVSADGEKTHDLKIDDQKFHLDPDTFDPDDVIELFGGGLLKKDVVVSRYEITTTKDGKEETSTHLRIRRADAPLKPVFDMQNMPHYLFFGASMMTAITLALLLWREPDLIVRMLFWMRSLQYRTKVIGVTNMPAYGPVILATNCDRVENCLEVLAATDRLTRFVFLRKGEDRISLWLKTLAWRFSVAVLKPEATTPETWNGWVGKAIKALHREEVVGLPADSPTGGPGLASRFFRELQGQIPQLEVPIVPVWCSGEGANVGADGRVTGSKLVRVVFGPPLPPDSSLETVQKMINWLGNMVEGNITESSAINTTAIGQMAAKT